MATKTVGDIVTASVPVADTTTLYQMLAVTSDRFSFLLAGRHGIGKSEIVTNWGVSHGYNVISLFLGQIGDPGDLTGIPREVNGVTEYSAPKWWPSVLDPRPVLLFLDELNRASRALTSAVFDLVLNKTLMGRKLPAGSRVISAINSGDAYDVRELEPAMLSRFNPFLFEPTVAEWLDWAAGANVDARVLEFIKEHPSTLDSDGKTDPTETYAALARTPDRRAWARFGRDLHPGRYFDRIQQLLLVSSIGSIVASQFAKSVEKYNSADWILNNKRILGKPCLDWGTWCSDVFRSNRGTEMLPILEAHPHPEIQMGALLLREMIENETARLREIEMKRRDPINALGIDGLPPMTLHHVTVAAPAVSPKQWGIEEKLGNLEWAVSVHGGPIQRTPVLAGRGKGVDWGGSDYVTEHDVPVLVNTFLVRLKNGKVFAAFGHYHQYLAIDVAKMGATEGPRAELTTEPAIPEKLRKQWADMVSEPTTVTPEFYRLLRDTIVAMHKAKRLTHEAYRCEEMASRPHEKCV